MSMTEKNDANLTNENANDCIFSKVTRRNLLATIQRAQNKSERRGIFSKFSIRKNQRYADSLVPATGNVYLMLGLQVNTKGKYVK